MILDFDSNIFLTLVFEWISLDALCFFDSAFCVARLRSAFLTSIGSKLGPFHWRMDEPMHENLIKWIQLRGICLENIRLDGRNVLQAIQQSDKSIDCHLLKSVVFDDSKAKSVNEFTRLLAKSSDLLEVGVKSVADVSPAPVFDALATHCHNLTKCDFTMLWKLSDESLTTLGARCRKLTDVNLTFCRQIGHEGVHSLVTHCLDLLHLDLACTGNIRDVTMTSIATHCRRLQ